MNNRDRMLAMLKAARTIRMHAAALEETLVNFTAPTFSGVYRRWNPAAPWVRVDGLSMRTRPPRIDFTRRQAE